MMTKTKPLAIQPILATAKVSGPTADAPSALTPSYGAKPGRFGRSIARR